MGICAGKPEPEAPAPAPAPAPLHLLEAPGDESDEEPAPPPAPPGPENKLAVLKPLGWSIPINCVWLLLSLNEIWANSSLVIKFSSQRLMIPIDNQQVK